MSEITITEDGNVGESTTYTVKIEGAEKGKKLTKIDAIMTLWHHLNLSPEEWNAVKSELQKLKS